VTEQPTPAPAGPAARRGPASLASADPMVLGSGALVAVGLVLLVVGVTGSWHWRAAVWGAVLASVAAFALVAVSATRRRGEFAPEGEAQDDVDQVEPSTAEGTDAAVPATRTSRPAKPAAPAAEPEPVPPRPRFSGFGKGRNEPAPAPPPPPQPSNVQVMHVQGGHVRVTPTPQPMPIARPDRTASRPPSAPPASPPTIQVGVPRDPGFRTYQPVDASATVIQVRNRYHRPECRYVTVADDAVETTLGEARATHAMPCGVCRP
jgi:hypothetical protein